MSSNMASKEFETPQSEVGQAKRLKKVSKRVFNIQLKGFIVFTDDFFATTFRFLKQLKTRYIHTKNKNLEKEKKRKEKVLYVRSVNLLRELPDIEYYDPFDNHAQFLNFAINFLQMKKSFQDQLELYLEEEHTT